LMKGHVLGHPLIVEVHALLSKTRVEMHNRRGIKLQDFNEFQ
jgi:hypothetical protein